MASKKLMATAELFLNTKNAKNDAKVFIDDLKKKLVDIESAADKMTVFKDMVGYIAKVDKALAALRENNKDVFNNVFADLDSDLKKQLENLFKVDGSQLDQLSVLRDNLNNLTGKSSIKEIRAFAKALNEVYESAGMHAPFADIESEFKEFSQAAKSKYIDLLSDQVSNFASVWKNVGLQISKGFGVGGNGISGLSQEIQEEIDKLKKQEAEIKNIFQAINDPKKVKVQLVQQADNQVAQLKELKNAFIAAADAKKQFEVKQMTGSPAYLEAVAKYLQVAAEVKSAFESNKLTKAGNEWIMASGIGVLQDADNVLDKFFVQNEELMDKIVNMYSDKIQNIGSQISFLEKPYETLKSTIEEYSELQKKMNHEDRFSNNELDAIAEKIKAIEKFLIALDKTGNKTNSIKEILGGIAFDRVDSSVAIEKLSKLFRIEIPEAAQIAADAIKDVGNASDVASANIESGVSIDAQKIREDTQETIDAIEYAKNELVKAWSKYYRAAQQAANDYDLILEDGETSSEMNRIKDFIDKKIDELGATATNPSKWGVKVDLDLSDAIADGDIDADGIEREIEKLIKHHGISFHVPIEDMKINPTTPIESSNVNIQNTANTVVDTIEIAKQKIVEAWRKYYRAIQEAKGKGFDPSTFDVFLMPDNVDSVYSSIQTMWDKWRLPNNQKIALNGIAEKINFSEVDYDQIPGMVNNLITFFEKSGEPLKIASDVISDRVSKINSTEPKVASGLVRQVPAMSSELDRADDKVEDVHASFQELVNYISQSGIAPGNLFHKIEAGARSVDEQLKSILQSLGLISVNGVANLSSINSGFTNKGGFISDKYTMIARPIVGPSGQKYLKKSENLQTRLAEAQQAGAQVGVIFDIIRDEANGLFYEIQNTVPGTAAFSHQQQGVNVDVLNASKEQLEGLINTIKELSKQKLFIDFGGDNILYDKDKGFSIIDLGLVGDQYHTVSSQNTLQENLDRFVNEYFKFAPSSMKADVQTMLADKLYEVANNIDPHVINPNVASKQDTINSSKNIVSSIKSEEVAHDKNTDAIDKEAAALEALIALKEKAQNMKWKDFAKDESLSGLKDTAGFTSMSQLEKFWKQARYEKKIDFHEISKDEAKKIFNDKLTPGLAQKWYGPANFSAKDQLENEILQDDEIRNAALSYLYHLYKNNLSSGKKNPNVKTFEDFLNTEFTLYRGDSSPLIYGDESKLSFSWNETVADGFNGNIGTIKLKPKDTIGNAGSIHESEVETFATNMKNSSWFKETNETFEDFYNKQTKEMQDEINVGLVNLEKRRVQDLLDENISKLTHKAGKDVDFQYGTLQQFQQGVVPDSLDVVGDGSISDQFAYAYNSLSDIDKRLVAYYAALEALSASLPKQFSELPKSVVGEDANLMNAVLNDPTGVQKHVAKLTGESQFGIIGQNAQDINVEANMHKLNAQAIEQEKQEQEALNQEKQKAARMWYDVSDKLHSDADGKDSYLVREIGDVWDGAKGVFDTASGKYSDPNLIGSGGYVNHITGEVQKVKDLINKIDDIMEKTGVDLSYVQDYLSEIYKNSDLDGLDKELNSIMSSAPSTDYDSVSSQLNRLVESKQGGTDEFDKLASVFHAIKDIDTTSKSNNADWLINDGKYMSDLTNVPLDVSDLYEVIDNIEQRYGENLQYVKDYLNKIYQSNTANELGSLFDDDLLIEDLDFTLPLDDNENFKKAYSHVLDELLMADDEKEKKLIELQGHLADLKTTDTDIIDTGYIQKSINGKVATIESVYALIDEIQQSYETDLTDVKNVLDEIFATYNGNAIDNDLSGFAKTEPVQFVDIYDKLFDTYLTNGDKAVDAKLHTLLIDLQGIDITNQLNKDLIDKGKFKEEFSGEVYDIGPIYNLIDNIQHQHAINLDYVKDYLNQVYKNYYDYKIDPDVLELDLEDDFAIDKDGQTLAFQSRKYSVQDYENMYGTQNASAQAAMNELALFYTEYVKLKEKIQQDPIEFLISPENATPDEIKQVQQALEKFQAIQKEITNMPLVETDDDLAKLQDLKAEAVGLQNYLRGATLSKNSPIGYDEAFNLSDFDATALHAITSIPSVNNIEKELDSAYHTIGDKMYDAIDDKFSVMIAEDMTNSLHDYLLQLGNQLKIEQQITAEKEQQKVLSDNDIQTGIERASGSDTGVYKGVDGDYALESTLQQTNGILNNILTAASTNGNAGLGGYKQSQEQTLDAEDVFKTNLSDKTKLFDAYKKGLDGVEYVVDSLRTELDGLDAQLQNITNQSDLDAWSKQFNILKDNIKASQSVFEQQNLGKINLYQKSLTNSYNKLTLPQQEELYDDYIKIIALLNKQKQSVEDGHAVELAGIKQITAALQEKIDKQIEANKAAKDAEKTHKKNAKFGDTAMINANAKYNKLSSIATSDLFVDSAVVSKAFGAYSDAYANMKKIRDELNNKGHEITSADEAAFKEAKDECNEYAKALEKLIKKTMDLRSSKANPDDYMLGSDFVDDKQGRIKALTDFAKQMYGVNVASTDFKDDWNKVVFAVDNGDKTFTEMTATFTDARNEIVAMAGDTKKSIGLMGQLWDQYKGKLKSVFSYFMASISIYDAWRVVKQGADYVREIDSALTELKKVTNETDASYTKFLQTMSKTGSEIGATVKDLTTMAAEWARLGYSMEEAGKLAKSTAILLNVSEFSDATKASEALISTMQAFQYTADKSQHVVDVLNEVGNNYAVSSDGIATALQDSASALMEGGNNLEQAVALVAAAMKNWLFI